MRTPERTNSRKQKVSLLGVIANGSTGDARRLLKKYNEPDAVNHKDLEMKLSKLYAKTDDKIKLEKEINTLRFVCTARESNPGPAD